MSAEEIGEVVLTITPDIKRFTAAMAEIGSTMQAYADRLARAFEQIGEAMRPLAGLFAGWNRRLRALERGEHIARFGPRNVDADGVWQSDLCAAWVHHACPSRFCSCGCHR